MAYVNFTTTYDNGMGVGPFPYSNLITEIGIKITANTRQGEHVGRPVSTTHLIAYDPTDHTKYAICNTINPSAEYVYDQSTSQLIGELKAQEFDMPLTASSWTFYGGLTGLSKSLAMCITDGNSFSPPSDPAPDGCGYWVLTSVAQFDQEVVTERYATTIDSCPIHAKRADMDANGDVIDTTYLKIANMPDIPTAGRNMNLNQYGAMQTKLPGGTFDAPANQSNSFERLTGADFAGAYLLACRHNTSDKYELAIAYTASGMSSSYSFIGTETIVALDNSVTTKQAVYIGETSLYTPTTKFGGSASTAFDPTAHKAIIYDGIGQIGPTSDCKIVIYSDANSNVRIAFTAIEVGKVGSTT